MVQYVSLILIDSCNILLKTIFNYQKCEFESLEQVSRVISYFQYPYFLFRMTKQLIHGTNTNKENSMVLLVMFIPFETRNISKRHDRTD